METVFFTKKDIKEILSGFVPIKRIKDEKNCKLIKEFNKHDNIFEFLDKNNLFGENFFDFYEILKPIKEKIKYIYESHNDIHNDFMFFIKRFKSEYNIITRKLRKSLENDMKCKNDELENQRMYDICTGIFSVSEADSRKFYFNLTWNNYSKKTILLQKNLFFLINSFYSYLYIKTEQILYFYWSLFNLKKDNDKLYLHYKFKFFLENCIFKIDSNIVNNDSFDKLNKIWIYFKHQDKKEVENYDFIYDEKQINEAINFVMCIYQTIRKIKKITIYHLK